VKADARAGGRILVFIQIIMGKRLKRENTHPPCLAKEFSWECSDGLRKTAQGIGGASFPKHRRCMTILMMKRVA